MNRPFVWAAAGLALGLWLAAQSSLAALSLFVFGIALSGALLVLGPPQASAWRAATIAALFLALAGPLWFFAGPANQRPLQAPEPRAITAEGVVQQVRLWQPGVRFTTLRVRADKVAIDGNPGPAPLVLQVFWVEPKAPVLPGARVQLRGNLAPGLGPENPAVIHYANRLHLAGVAGSVEAAGAEGVQVLAPPPWYSLRAAAERVRQWQAAHFERWLPAGSQAFARAVWLGAGGDIDDAAYQRFLASGTAHVLAVSGVHVGLIYLVLMSLLGQWRLGPRAQAVLIIAGVFAFALIAGGRITGLRAALMLSLAQVAVLLGREPDPRTIIAQAAILFLAWQPALLFDAGFLLSFGSVASLLLFAAPVAERLAWLPRGLRGPVSVALTVQLVPLPIALSAFHTLPLYAPLVNLLVVPALGLLLAVLFAAVALGALWSPLGALFGAAASVLIAAIEAAAAFTAALPGSHVLLGTPPFLARAAYWAALALFAAGLWHHLRWRVALPALAMALLLAYGAYAFRWPVPGIDFIATAQGDPILITHRGRSLLVDGAGRRDARVLEEVLYARGVRALDFLILTEVTRARTGALEPLLDKWHIEKVLLPPASGSDVDAAFAVACAEAGVEVERASGHGSRPWQRGWFGWVVPPGRAELVIHVCAGSKIVVAGGSTAGLAAYPDLSNEYVDWLRLPDAPGLPPRALRELVSGGVVIAGESDVGWLAVPEEDAERLRADWALLPQWRLAETGGLHIKEQRAPRVDVPRPSDRRPID